MTKSDKETNALIFSLLINDPKLEWFIWFRDYRPEWLLKYNLDEFLNAFESIKYRVKKLSDLPEKADNFGYRKTILPEKRDDFNKLLDEVIDIRNEIKRLRG